MTRAGGASRPAAGDAAGDAPGASAAAITRAGPDAAPAMHALMRVCAADLRRRGFHNWDVPPAPERLAEMASTRTLLVARPVSDARAGIGDDQLLGAVFVGATALRPYDTALAAGEVRWDAPDPKAADWAPAAYVNSLAVHPTAQGRGLGAALMRAAEAAAAAWGARTARLDALATNAALLDFYKRLGYVPRGRRAHDGWTFTCLERPLPPHADG